MLPKMISKSKLGYMIMLRADEGKGKKEKRK
jgi:hypothetical protein